MQTETSRTERTRSYGERVARVVVPVGVAIVAWLVVLLVIGFVAQLDSLSVLNLLPIVIIAVLFWPVYLAAPWRPGLTERVRRALITNRGGVVGAAVLFVVRSLPLTPDVLVTLLDLPFRSAGVLFGAGLFYRQLISPVAGRVLLSFGQWYLEALWLFILGHVLAGAVGRLR